MKPAGRTRVVTLGRQGASQAPVAVSTPAAENGDTDEHGELEGLKKAVAAGEWKRSDDPIGTPARAP